MDTSVLDELKRDFAEWSGGFPPDSMDQIEVYMDYILPVYTDPIAAREALVDWWRQEADEQTPASVPA